MANALAFIRVPIWERAINPLYKIRNDESMDAGIIDGTLVDPVCLG